MVLIAPTRAGRCSRYLLTLGSRAWNARLQTGHSEQRQDREASLIVVNNDVRASGRNGYVVPMRHGVFLAIGHA